eukprot:5493814-Prymnesium_polylepis.1
MSSLGRCHSFDLRADGYARAEACSSMVLNREQNALVAQIRELAVQQDGRSASLTAPNGLAQARLLDTLYSDVGVVPPGLSLLEAHATGTRLGDPIEMGAIVKAAAPLGSAGILSLSCTKANVAHSETGAGMTGLLALMHSLGANESSPNAQLNVLNPHVGDVLSRTNIALPTQRSALSAAQRRHDTTGRQILSIPKA